MRLSRSTGFLSGLLLVVLGLWGGLVPFVGPYFHYAFGYDRTWFLTTERLWLDILPALAVVIGGSVILRAGHRVSGTAGAWLAIAGGTWFLIGPAMSLLWHHGPGPIGGPLGGNTRQMFEWVGYFYGLGAVVIGFAAFALGRFVSRPALVAEPLKPLPAREFSEPPSDAEPTGPVVGGPVSVEPSAPGPVLQPGTLVGGDPTRPAEPIVTAAGVAGAGTGGTPLHAHLETPRPHRSLLHPRRRHAAGDQRARSS